MSAAPHPVPFRRRMLAVSVSCIGLVALADWLFYEHPVGWTAGLYLLVLVGLLLWRGGPGLNQPAGRVLLAASVGLVAALVVHPSTLALTYAVLAVGFLGMTVRGGW